MDQTAEKIYEQANENWRFLAKWRQLAFAGHLAVVAGALTIINSAADHAYPPWVIAIFFFSLSGICCIFRMVDKRTHRLTMDACNAGVALEGGRPGFFTVNAETDKKSGIAHSAESKKSEDTSGEHGVKRSRSKRKRWESHSKVARLLFYGTAAVFGAAGVLCVSNWICGFPYLAARNSNAWEYEVIQGKAANSGISLVSLNNDLNHASADGWEFVAVGSDSGGGSFVILRRQKR